MDRDPAARLSDDDAERLLDSWAPDRSKAPVPGPSLSKHGRLEVAAAVRAGHRPGDAPPLAEEDPVPGCSCVRCVLLARGASLREARWAEGAVRDLARIDPSARLPAAGLMAEAADDLNTPSPGWLCRRAAALPWAVEPSPDPADRDRDELPVEDARRASIIRVARRLGLGDPEPRGRERAVECPWHDDTDPSLRLEPDRGLFFCFPCSIGGDTIDLVMSVRDVDFPAAIRWIAEGR